MGLDTLPLGPAAHVASFLSPRDALCGLLPASRAVLGPVLLRLCRTPLEVVPVEGVPAASTDRLTLNRALRVHKALARLLSAVATRRLVPCGFPTLVLPVICMLTGHHRLEGGIAVVDCAHHDVLVQGMAGGPRPVVHGLVRVGGASQRVVFNYVSVINDIVPAAVAATTSTSSIFARLRRFFYRNSQRVTNTSAAVTSFPSTESGFSVHGVGTRVRLVDCEAVGCRHGVLVGRGASATLSACALHDNRSNGLRVEGAGTECEAAGCTFSDNEGNGVAAWNGATCTVVGSRSVGNRFHGIQVQGTGTKLLVSGTELSANQCGLCVATQGRASVASCTIVANKRMGMAVMPTGGNITAKSTQVGSNRVAGIWAAGAASASRFSTDCQVMGNLESVDGGEIELLL